MKSSLKEAKRLEIKKFIDDKLNEKDFNVLKEIKQEVEMDGGSFVSFYGDIFYLVGATSTDEDYYYLCLDKDAHIVYESCVGVHKKLEQTPKGFEKLLKEIKNNKSELLKRIEDSVNGGIDVLFTKIYL